MRDRHGGIVPLAPEEDGSAIRKDAAHHAETDKASSGSFLLRHVIIVGRSTGRYKGGKTRRYGIMEQIQAVSLDEARHFLEEHPDGMIIDVLTPEFHAMRHIPHAVGVCVFETAFQDKMKNVAPSKSTPLLLYGAGQSLDSRIAAEKLQREGYTQLFYFEDGLEAWQEAGLPLEGQDVTSPLREESPLPRFSRYRLDVEKSVIRWEGRNSAHGHDGSVSLSYGELRFPDGPNKPGQGLLTVDMTTIRCRDLEGSPLMPVLIAHLESMDFFDVTVYPAAQLNIEDLSPLPEPTLTGYTHYLRGKLRILRTEKDIECNVSLRNQEDGGLGLTCQLTMDRTLWGVHYGSARYYRFLGMHGVDDMVALNVNLVFQGQETSESVRA